MEPMFFAFGAEAAVCAQSFGRFAYIGVCSRQIYAGSSSSIIIVSSAPG
jgi:hypothetical protein